MPVLSFLFSTAIKEGHNFSELPKTIIISILGFNQFKDRADAVCC